MILFKEIMPNFANNHHKKILKSTLNNNKIQKRKWTENDSPVPRTPGSFDSTVHRTPGSFDSPVHWRPGSFDSPVHGTPGSFESPVPRTLGNLDSPVHRTPGSHFKMLITQPIGKKIETALGHV